MNDEEDELETDSAWIERRRQDEVALLQGHQTSSVCLHPSAGYCATCADEALPARVLRVAQEAGMALVAVDDATTEVDISLVDELAPDDLVLIHGGVAIAKL